MKNYFRKLMVIGLGLGISLTGVNTTLAAALNYSVDTIVTIDGIDYTILAGSAATTVIVGTSSISVTVPASSTFTLRSPDQFALNSSQNLSQTCTATENDVTVTGPATVTITPEEIACVPSEDSTTSSRVIGHAAGSVVKTPDGTVWFITDTGQRRPFTSAGAFLSYGFLSFSQVVNANTKDLAIATGAFIAPRDGSLFCATATKGTDVSGECALITSGMKAAFTSSAVFRGLGFSFSNAQYGDSSFLTKTSNIATTAEAHRPGVLVNNNGTIQVVGSSSLVGIPSMAVFSSWGYSLSQVVPANTFDKALPQSGIMSTRPAAQLNPTGF